MRKTKRLPLEELRPWLLPDPPRPAVEPGVAPPPPLPSPPFEWPTLFGNAAPVEVEVGFGKGMFLLAASAANPGVNYLGVEIVRKYVLLTASRLATRKVPNVRVACGDAKLLLRDRVPAGSLRAVHVYFPDPWWKKRHHKRRLYTPEFVELCERVLAPGGRLHVVTDVEDYFTRIVEATATRPAFDRLDVAALPGLGEGEYLTNFERKYRVEGRPIHRAAYEKRQAVAE